MLDIRYKVLGVRYKVLDMKESIMRNKSLEFAIRIVSIYKYLSEERKEFVLSRQLLRSGTAVGAMLRESEHAESPADFIHKFAIAQKECNETAYWLELLNKTNYLNDNEYKELSNSCIELLKMITATIITMKRKTKI